MLRSCLASDATNDFHVQNQQRGASDQDPLAGEALASAGANGDGMVVMGIGPSWGIAAWISLDFGQMDELDVNGLKGGG